MAVGPADDGTPMIDTVAPPEPEPEGAEAPTASRLQVFGHTLSRVMASAWLWVWLWLTLIAFGWALSPAWNAWVVSSGSMAPALEVGDVVLTVAPEHPLGEDTVITYEHDGRIITHRIEETILDEAGRPIYVTQGDANRVADTWEVQPHDVLGVGRVAVPHAGLPGWWVSNGPVWLAVLFVLGTAAAAWWSTHPPDLPGARDPYAVGRHRAPRRVEIWMPTLWPRAHVLALLVAAVLVTAAGWAATDAFFSGQTANAANTFTAVDDFGPTGGYPGAVLASQPVAYWRLGEGGGTASDAMGLVDGSYDGCAASSTGLVDDPDAAAEFANCGIDLGNANPITKTQLDQRTVELWFRPASTSGRQVLYDEGGNARQIAVYLDGSTLHAYAHDNTWDTDLDATVTIAAGTTYHVVAVLDATGNDLALHVNGSLVAMASKSDGADMGVRAGGMSIGRASGQMRYHDGQDRSTNAFTGTIDEVAVYDRALTIGEIQDHWAAGN